MSDRKLSALDSDRVSRGRARGLVNRQVDETRRIAKNAVSVLAAAFPDAEVRPVKSGLAEAVRERYGLVEPAVVNDLRHAHEAYLACRVGRFLEERFPLGLDRIRYEDLERMAAATGGDPRDRGVVADSFGVDGFDPETGEVFRDGWLGSLEVDRLRSRFAYRGCFVSRKVERFGGAFWNATVYSPLEPSPKAIPLKKGLPTDRYGHYLSRAVAFSTVAEHWEVRRGKRRRAVSFVDVPVDVAYGLRGEEDLEAYLRTVLDEPVVLRASVPKNQLIVWDGAPYYMSSSSEAMNARQLWLPRRFVDLLAALEADVSAMEGDEAAAGGLAELADHLLKAMEERYPRYSRRNGLCSKLRAALDASFGGMGVAERLAVVEEMLALLHCDRRNGLSSIGLSPSAGRLSGLSLGASIDDIVFVDTSVTGMFERRSTVVRG